MDLLDDQFNQYGLPAPPAQVPEPEKGGQERGAGRAGARRYLFPVAAVLCGLAVFPVVELLCVVCQLAPPSAADDPWVGFAGIRPLFEVADDPAYLHTSPARRGFFEEEQFLLQKPENEFRIFVFGGSTVQGCPYSIQTSFTAFLQILLNRAAPGHSWNVINCGGISYASYRLLPIMQECLQYQPDLMIVCTGHNEFLEDVSYSELRDPSAAMTGLYGLASHFRSYRLLRDLLRPGNTPVDASPGSGLPGQHPRTGARVVLPMEADALLDHQGGLEAYRRNDQHARSVARHFQFNLFRMKQMCDQARLPLLLLRPPSNLSDCPPFKAVPGDDVSDSEQQEIRNLLTDAGAHMQSEPQVAAELLQECTQRDPRFAFSWYQLGHAWKAVGQAELARNAFLRARDEDVCPLRMTSALEAAMFDMVSASRTPFLDVAALLQDFCVDGITGDNVLVDHIHPSFRSHQRIALAISDWMQQTGLLAPTAAGWADTIDEHFANHLQSLDNMYFLKGRRRLQDLQGWAAGRAEGPPLMREPQSPE